MTVTTIPENHLADIMGVSRRTLALWKASGKVAVHYDEAGAGYFYVKDLVGIPEIHAMAETTWDAEYATRPLRPYTSIELFAGAGGLA